MLINKELGIKYPIFLGAMARITDARFASVISNAGGLGVIASGDMTKDEVKKEIDLIRTLTSKPFGVNIMLQSPYSDDIVDLIIEEKVPIVIFGAGSPVKYMDRLNEANVKVFAVVSSTSFANRLYKYNPFGFIVEGTESGGHVGYESTLPLIQVFKKEFPNARIIAAGGFATGESLNAALMMGCQGIQMGTRFLASEEANVDIKYKEAIINSRDNKTTLTGLKFGLPVRVIKNEMSTNYHKIEKDATSVLDLELLTVGSLKKAISGDVINGSLMAGEISSVISEIKPVKKIFEDIILEAKEANKKYLSLMDEINNL